MTWLSKTDLPRKRRIEEVEEEEFSSSVRTFDPLITATPSPVKSSPAVRVRGGNDVLLRRNLKVTQCRSSSSRTPPRVTKDRYMPKNEVDLAVNPKKIAELKGWMRSKLTMERPGPKSILITGPSGCGKSTTLKVLCSEMGVEVVEFDGSEYELSTLGEIWERPNWKIFQEFIRNAELSSINKVTLKHRLLLIEQLPGNFYKDPKLLHQMLWEFARFSHSLIAFVLSNIDSNWELSPQRLFPQEVLEALQVHHLKFTAISTTLLTRALTRVARKMGTSQSSEALSSISASAEGDLRRAINTLEFYSRSGRKCGRNMPLSGSAKQDKQSIACHFDLFHFIGKVMYAKRAPQPSGEWSEGEARLRASLRPKFSKRHPPKDDLNWLVASAAVSSPLLADYIFEHEPNFAPSVSSMASLLSNLAMADAATRTGNMEEQGRMSKYLLEISIRSTIFYNERKEKKGTLGFYPFGKPQYKDLPRKTSQSCYRDFVDSPAGLELSACYRCLEGGHSLLYCPRRPFSATNLEPGRFLPSQHSAKPPAAYDDGYRYDIDDEDEHE